MCLQGAYSQYLSFFLMEFGLICLILEITRVKLESENVIRVRKMTQLTRVTQLELPTLLTSLSAYFGSSAHFRQSERAK